MILRHPTGRSLERESLSRPIARKPPTAYVLRVPRKIADLTRRFGDQLLAVGLVTLMIVQVWLLDVSTVDKLAMIVTALALFVPLARRVRLPITLMAVFATAGLLGQLLPKRVTDVEAFRERVSVYGGELDAGPQADGGYAVRARLPYASER